MLYYCCYCDCNVLFWEMSMFKMFKNKEFDFNQNWFEWIIHSLTAKEFDLFAFGKHFYILQSWTLDSDSICKLIAIIIVCHRIIPHRLISARHTKKYSSNILIFVEFISFHFLDVGSSKLTMTFVENRCIFFFWIDSSQRQCVKYGGNGNKIENELMSQKYLDWIYLRMLCYVKYQPKNIQMMNNFCSCFINEKRHFFWLLRLRIHDFNWEIVIFLFSNS